MKKNIGIALCFALLALLGLTSTFAEEMEKTFSTSITTTYEYDYWLILPDDSDPAEKLPLVLFLHGAGERGNYLPKVKKHGPFSMLEQDGFKAILVAPQCPKDQWWNPEVLSKLLTQVEQNYPVDPDRVYLTGLSMGGYGSWALAAMEPDRFAAVAPICGGGNPEDAKKLVGVPVWAFHGDADKVVPLEKGQAMVNSLEEAGGNPKFTIYPEVGHNSWTQTYDDPAFYEWMFAQTR